MKRYFTLLLLLASVQCLMAAFPKVSTETDEYWYYLKFTQGAFVVASDGDGALCKALVPTGKQNQLWKVEGSSSAGYTFTNKLGLQLYVSGTSQGSGVYAASEPTSLNKFRMTTRGSYYAICPTGNTGQSFNSWGGMGLRNDIKLYDSNDANAPMEFVAEADMTVSNALVNVIPYPTSVKVNDGMLDLHQLSAIVYVTDSTGMLAQRLADDLLRTAGIKVATLNAEKGTGEGVMLNMTLDGALGNEAYQLTVTATGIQVTASDYGGFFNALQTLRQLMPAAIFGQTTQTDIDWSIPLVSISDTPAMHHRGFHLDVSRHFFDKSEVKKLLDAASIYKLNRFHWHLTDDQGWRIEIPEYPRLTTVGAIRKASMSTNDPSNGTQFFDDTEYGRGCFYTLDDLREIVSYARERNIEIIPEVDLPGHMVAALAAYPELSCNPSRTYQVMTNGGISSDVLNVGKDEVIDFLKCVLGHVAEVFPYELIHIGGDECPTTAWQNNSDCSRRIKEEGLSSVNDLQPWLVEELGTFLMDKYGKRVVVWDELLAHWNSDNKVQPVIMAWRGTGYTSQAADKGFQSICVPSSPLYLDQLQVSPSQLEIDSPYMGGYGDNSVNSVERIYNFNPRSSVSGREQYVLGTQGNLWTESCTSNREAEYQYYPRLLAISEIAWLPNSKKDFAGFYYRLQSHSSILEAKEICYAPHYFEPAELTPAEQAINEAERILEQSHPGSVGYPSQTEADALQQALGALRNAPTDAGLLDVLRNQIQAYKDAPIKMPEEGHLYQIISASTFFRNRFDGSSLYTDGTSVSIHYTPQAEPQEAWQFMSQTDGTYQLVSASTGKALSIKAATDGAVSANTEKGTNLTIRKATRGAGTYTYIPGVVNIKNGKYNLYAKLTSHAISMVASTDSTLCYPGTWRIEEVTDYRYWLQKLLDKAELVLETADPTAEGQPTEAALEFLSNQVIGPARSLLENDEVSQQEYLGLAALYMQFMSMDKTSVVDAIDEGCYYLIRNAYFTNYYAAANSSTKGIVPKTLTSAATFRWAFVRNDDGTVTIRNKQTNTEAYVASSAAEQRLQVGKDYHWSLKEITTDQGNTAIAIIDRSGAYSWYTNPNAWDYILLKPYDWGASVWQLEKTSEEIPDAIIAPTIRRGQQDIYDLSGRRMQKVPRHGVYIQGGQKIIK